MTAPPLYATPRNPDRPSDGAQIGVIARSLGTPLIPWQQQVADVASERRADGSYEYQVVVVSVPRQTGKTTLIRAMAVHSALVLGRTVFYTAQTGKDARERWSDLVKILQVHPALARRFKLTLRGGSEQVEFHRTGAAVRAFAPTPESLHGYTPPKVVIDEAFAQGPAQGELLMGAIGPAQFTIVDRQLWIVSTAGTAESTFLHDWIDRGIEGTPRVAAFVWGATDEQDPFSLDDIARFHPGVGHRLNGKLLSAQDVLEQADRNSRAEYERAYANRRTLTLSHLIPSEVWRDLGDPELAPPSSTSDAVLTFDVDNTRESSTITATWADDRGHPLVKVVKAGPGMGWLAAAVDQLRRDWRPRELVAVGNGPVLDVVARVNQLAGDDVVKVLTEREYAAACTGLLSRIEEGTIGHDGGELLLRSVVGLVTRPAGGDGVAFSRRHSVGDSSPAIAAAAGSWVLTTTRKAAPPLVYFGKATA